MILIVGLGNPGRKYQKARHNIGFRVLDEFQRGNDFPCFRLSKKFNSLISEGEIGGKKILLAKPQTFMNKSGLAVKSFICNKTAMAVIVQQLENLWVVHDDIDLPLGKIRISKGRGSAGHKGVESIIKEIGTKNFVRFRIGIKPNSKVKIENAKLQFKIQNVEDFVLKKFTKDEEKVVKKIIQQTCQALKKTALTNKL